MPVRSAPNFFFWPIVFFERMLKIAVFQPFDLEFSKDELDKVSSFSAQT